jgi:hypothetical protein
MMKKILLLTILTIGYYLSGYSQAASQVQRKRFQIDTALMKLSQISDLTILSFYENKDSYDLLSHSILQRFQFHPDLSKIEAKNGQDYFSVDIATSTFDQMPCLYPQGFSTMPVIVPDSTVNYTLQIKNW